MTTARKRLIDVNSTPFYHLTNRCVRRAFLCGIDTYSGIDYSHRRQWFMDKLFQLETLFCIDIAAYAVMSNHYHLVLRIDTERALTLSHREVVTLYSQLHKPHPLVARYVDGESVSKAEWMSINEYVSLYRTRLSSLSWFMKCLNEHIARKANREDNVTGKFWESRFKSQALLDETALLTCMAYVDLNPIRAKMATTPEQSDFTSVQARIQNTPNAQALLPFSESIHSMTSPKALPLSHTAYLELVDWSGRCIRENKRGAIPANLPPILTRLNTDTATWLRHTRYFEVRFKRAAGSWAKIKAFAERVQQQWLQGKPPKSKPQPT